MTSMSTGAQSARKAGMPARKSRSAVREGSEDVVHAPAHRQRVRAP